MKYDFYKIPFVSPLMLMGQEYQFKYGAIISTPDGLKADISHFPQLDNLNQVEFNDYTLRLVSNFDNAKYCSTLPPAFQFAREQIMFQIEGNSFEEESVESNILLFSSQEIPETISCPYLKIKISNDFETESKWVENVLALHPESILRLDANRSLSLENLINWNNFFKRFPNNLDYFEEPIMNPEELIEDISVGWDESSKLFLEKKYIPPQTKAFVIKPSFFGGITHTLKIMDDLNKRNIPIIISSSFESPIGMKVLNFLANKQNLLSKTAHGLDTLKFLELKDFRL